MCIRDRYIINLFEYYGIKKLYDLSQTEPNKIYLYFHSKGMFNYRGIGDERTKEEIILTKTIINPWSSVLNIFKNNLNINIMGMFPSTGGWIWFNFFWIRGSYIKNKCDDPKITDNRYYYESWIADINNPKGNELYNMYKGNFIRYSGEEALQLLDKYIL